jgi:penicillin G amidase
MTAATRPDALEQPAAPARTAPRGHRVRRAVAVIGVLVLVVLVAAGGFLTWTVHRSVPTVDGSLDVAGLQSTTEVVRDARGVPQIYADTSHDLFMAQGYVHAQDRFWEMDMRRHITAGRLSELFGPGELTTDAVVRTLGWRRVAEQEVALLSEQTRSGLQAYADGVNAYLAQRSPVELSAEYAVLGLVVDRYTPEPWTIVDSLAWLKAMAWDLRGNLSEETQRALMLSAMDRSEVEQLYPGYDFAHQATVVSTPQPQAVVAAGAAGAGGGTAVSGSAASVGPAASAMDSLGALLGPGGPGIGSNAWVVSGSRTTTGRPMLANDPHLGPSQPGIWYQNGLHCRVVGAACPYDVTGFSFAGMPAVVIGHNADVAWGFTNIGADVTDLVLEKVDGDTYEYQDRRLPVASRTEVIAVAGGAPVTITVRSTQNGPIISDALPAAAEVGAKGVVPGIAPRKGGYAVALRWTALQPRDSVQAVFALDVAHDWTSFRAAAAEFAVPAQNMLYADRVGNIGYQMPGAIPIRSGGGNGRYPVAGWTGHDRWVGEIPFAALPTELNPPSGYIVSANNAVVGPDYPYLITTDWTDGYRSDRIAQLITAAGKVDVNTLRAIQADTLNPMAAQLDPYLLAVRPGAAALPAQDLLRAWDGTQPVDSAAAAYFNAVWRHLLALTFTDDLARTAADPDPDGGGRWFQAVAGMLDRPDDPLWANAADPRDLRTRDDVLRAAMDDASAELRDRLGSDPAGWRWGALHTVTLTNATLGTGGPAPVQWALNQAPVEMPGGSAAVNATGWDARDGYAVDWGPSFRMVVDLADLDASGWVNQTGASGHAFSAHYADQTATWAAGRTFDWPFSAGAVNATAVSRLDLNPPGRGDSS